MSAYLITGGAGFIGSHLAETLVKQGHRVRVLDNLSTGKEANLEPASGGPGELDFLEGDIRELDTCQRAMEGMDYVLHQAARASVPRSVADPLATNAVNVNGSLNLLYAAKEAQVKRMVLASSSSVYGNVDPPDAPKVESQPPRPMSPYAASKVSMEHYASAFYQVYGLETVCLRYFNIFGPRQDPDSPYAAVIPKFLFCLLQGERPPVHGDGRQSRDFTYIDNVVAANLAACAAPDAPGQAINVAAGVSHDLLELLDILGELTGKPREPEFQESRAADVYYSLADLSKARELLGYEPKVDFREGLGRLAALAQEGRYLA
ncbi:MAG: SDR family oxidoreductase [Desulfarculaceae bacterium]|nr:SDR family oxidoreductase [Desulfarculaceae bacterium]MCF8072263.1 SDR family oxidoreductase [Desulfarculaceae bacterium]MCF8100184.1 SDR family oxidoreductase [Desulfarculaceae bacterium]MCF8117872.1 SDR family oxidoreductase [Desulfarculaceae bacterium]